MLNKVKGFNPEDFLENAKDTQGLNVLGEDGQPLRYLSTDSKVLWFRLVHPEGRILAEQLPSPSPSIVRFRADVFTEKTDAKPVSSFEYQKTWRENCGDFDAFVSKVQTVALGKALSRAGFGCEIEACCNRGGISADALFDAESEEPEDTDASAPKPQAPVQQASVQQAPVQDAQEKEQAVASDSSASSDEETPAPAEGEISADEIFRSMEVPSPEEKEDLNFPPAIDVPEEEEGFPVGVETEPNDGVLENQVFWSVNSEETEEKPEAVEKSTPVESEKKSAKKKAGKKAAKAVEVEPAEPEGSGDAPDAEESQSEEQDKNLDQALNTVFRLKENAEELGISQGLVTLSWQNVTLGEILKDHKDFLKVILDHKKIREGVAPEVVSAAEVIRESQK